MFYAIKIEYSSGELKFSSSQPTLSYRVGSIHAGAHLCDEVTGDVFVILHHLVDDAARGELDDAVGHGLDELVVVAAEEDVAFIKL